MLWWLAPRYDWPRFLILSLLYDEVDDQDATRLAFSDGLDDLCLELFLDGVERLRIGETIVFLRAQVADGSFAREGDELLEFVRDLALRQLDGDLYLDVPQGVVVGVDVHHDGRELVHVADRAFAPLRSGAVGSRLAVL